MSRMKTITFPNKVGNIDEVAKRLAKSIANQGVRLKVDQLGLLWELLQACGANESDFRADDNPVCDECSRPFTSHKLGCSWRRNV